MPSEHPTAVCLSGRPLPQLENLRAEKPAAFHFLGYFPTIDDVIEENPGVEPSLFILPAAGECAPALPLIRQLRTSFPGARQVVIAGSDQEQHMICWLRNGVNCCLPLSVTAPELAVALRETFRHGVYFFPRWARWMVQQF